jgi:4-hydroxythreonine-4-phosphate dehydrogenase
VRAEEALARLRTPCRWWRPAKPRRREPGQPDDTSATAAIASIRQAVADVIAGRAGAVVTNPIAKSVLYRAGFRHPGHTEFLAELAARGRPAPAAGDDAVVAGARRRAGDDPPSLREALAQLTSELIVDDRAHRGADLKARFGIARPRLAISPASIRMPARTARSAPRTTIVAPRSKSLRARASTRAGRCRPTPCSTKPRARPTTARSACITTRR